MNVPTVLCLLGVLMAIGGACMSTMNGDLMWTALYAALGVLAVLMLRKALAWEPEEDVEDEDETDGEEDEDEPTERIGA